MGNCHTADTDTPPDLPVVPPPIYCDTIWSASCRAVGSCQDLLPYTFIFQPDVQLFCSKGLDCDLLHSAPEGYHSQTLIHTTHEVIKRFADGHTTAVVNCTDRQILIPRVPRCWIIDQTIPSCTIQAPRAPLVYIWVHGYRQRYFRVQAVASHLHHRLRRISAQTDQEELPFAVLSFIWPGHTAKAAYMRAKTKASGAAQHLHLLIKLLHARGQKIVVVAHSMGCRVALNALNESEAQVSRLVLLGAAVPANAFTSDWPRHKLGAEEINVFYSAHDEALGTGFWVGEALSGEVCKAMVNDLKPLGLVGVQPVVDIPNVESVNVTSEVEGHNPNRWLMSSRVSHALGLELPRGGACGESDVLTDQASDDIAWHDIIDSEDNHHGQPDP